MNRNPPEPSTLQFSRRQFLARSAAGTALWLTPGALTFLRGGVSANSKLNVAGIGIGGQGAGDLANMEGENIVALCDVDQRHVGHVFAKYAKARRFTDYRKMLDDLPEIDGVVIATPDHHHAPASAEAMRRGKHVYCEKPLTHSVFEAREVAKLARQARVATQMGNQGQDSNATRQLSQQVWSGVIGNVLEVHIWTDRPAQGLFNEYWPQGVDRPKDTPPVPPTLDWNLWLGPAPNRPYHPAYLPFKWRGWWDFGTGALGDIGCHAMDPVFRALKLGAPASVQAASTRVHSETYPLGSMVTYEFPERTAAPQAINTHIHGGSGVAAGAIRMPACKLVWYDGGLRPPRPPGLPNGVKMGDNGRLLLGEKGFILGNEAYSASGRRLEPGASFVIPPSPGHYKEWILACKGGPAPGSNFDWAGPLTEAVLLGNVALRLQLREDLTVLKLEWDDLKLRFTNSEDATRFLKREYRAGWKL
jgi:predicted dehydrogenase